MSGICRSESVKASASEFAIQSNAGRAGCKLAELTALVLKLIAAEVLYKGALDAEFEGLRVPPNPFSLLY